MLVLSSNPSFHSCLWENGFLGDYLWLPPENTQTDHYNLIGNNCKSTNCVISVSKQALLIPTERFLLRHQSTRPLVILRLSQSRFTSATPNWFFELKWFSWQQTDSQTSASELRLRAIWQLYKRKRERERELLLLLDPTDIRYVWSTGLILPHNTSSNYTQTQDTTQSLWASGSIWSLFSQAWTFKTR